MARSSGTAPGPALVFSFLLLGGACALAALCYAELAAMIPQAGSAYAYTYATLGELVAWIIGWDLILEYAVGNVAVAISWGDYFTTLLRGVGVSLPEWLTTGYRTALLSSDPASMACCRRRRTSPGVPVLSQRAGLRDCDAHHVAAAARRARELAREQRHGVIKLVALALFIGVGATHITPANYVPFAPNGFTGIHQGAAIVFFAYIGFDAISTAAEETRNPQRNLPIGILGGLAICTVIYVIVGAVADRHGAVSGAGELGRPARACAASRRVPDGRLDRALGRGRVDDRRAARVPVRASPGSSSRWRATGCCRSGPRSAPEDAHSARHDAVHRRVCGARGALVGDAAETYDLTNIGTLFAFALVCIGVLVLRVTEPQRPRPFRVPLVWPWRRSARRPACSSWSGCHARPGNGSAMWLAVGLALYFAYGFGTAGCRAGAASSG